MTSGSTHFRPNTYSGGTPNRRTSENSPSTHSGEYRSVEEQKFILAVPSLMVPYSACVGRARMNRREFLALGGAGAVASGLLSLAEAMSGGSDAPNLLVIITDDQPYYTVSHTKA